MNDARRDITIRRASLGAEDERLDREFWACMTPEQRVEEAWRITLELWEFKGWDPGEPGLRRVASRIERR